MSTVSAGGGVGGGGSTPLLRVDRLTVRFGGVTALDGVSFQVAPGQVCGLIGPNGAGKTTLFDCVSRLTRPQRGRVELDGRDLGALAAHEVAALGIARTFQHLGLFGSLSVRENVMLGGHHACGVGFTAAALRLPRVRRSERATRRRADEVLERLGLAHLASRPAAGLPYGTLKRIELARALGAAPRLLLLDEPSLGLAPRVTRELFRILGQIEREQRTTMLLVEQNANLALELAEHAYVLEGGRTVLAGPAQQVRTDEHVRRAYLGV